MPKLPGIRAPKPRTSTLGVLFLITIPTLLVLTCAILILVYQQSAFDVAMGVLLVMFCSALGAGASVTILALRADRKLAALQLDFVSKVSHELKTPLTSIRMFVDTLKLGRIREQSKIDHCLDVIATETDRLSGLIGRLLSWGAMESGAFTVKLTIREPGEIVRRALAAFEPQALVGDAILDVTIAKDLPRVKADEAALVDALLNLLSNALRYGGEEKRVWIDVHRWHDGAVAMTVRDEGIGIDLNEQTKIFERFYRADERYARSAGGTGLGLAIARYIVDAHGGSISLKSKLGEGSEFTILLPPAESATAETAA